MTVGLYEPGSSVLHRLGAGVKLLSLLVFGVGLVTLESVGQLSAITIAVGLTFASLGAHGLTRLWQTTRPLIWWLVVIALAQGFVTDAVTAMRVLLRLLALVWMATLVTHTTKLSDMTDCLVKVSSFLKPFGVSPSRVAFMVALTVRLIPALGELVHEVRDAQRARGLERSVLTAVVPILTRVLQQADVMSDALTARGYDRWDEAA